MASGSKFSFTDMQNPLFLHPSDNPLSVSVTKLQGASDYRTWRRSMEIQLSSKRKLGFVDGTEIKSSTDATEAVQWDTCNSMVTSWLHNNISDSIKQSILFITSASEVWSQLEKRFQLTHGSRKYRLSKELFAIKQNGAKIVEYYTSLSSLWAELDAINLLPPVVTVAEDVSALLKAIQTQKEETRLFQFLNGLDESYGPLRSQLLMLNPLPSVEMASASIQQEESQRDLLKNPLSSDVDVSAMYSKTTSNLGKPPTCGTCGGRGHTSDKCWNTVGYPKWHYKYKPPQQHPTSRPHPPTQPRWSTQKPSFSPRGPSASYVTTDISLNDPTNTPVTFSPQQFQQLLQLLPTGQMSTTQETDEDHLDSPFSGMISCHSVKASPHVWIVDTGATDHMTSNLGILTNVKPMKTQMSVNLPNGARAVVTRVGDVLLQNGLKLLNVLYVPTFTHNLLSIHKLSQDNECFAVFSPTSCKIVDSRTYEERGKGVVCNGLYHMSNSDCKAESSKAPHAQCMAVTNQSLTSQYTLWHNRLGHAPVSKLKFIDCVKHCAHVADQVCITCPMAKFTKLPFSLSESRAAKAFELIHTDIWGPYKVNTRQRFKLFLTIVDDYSRTTWVYLIQHKSDYLKTLEVFYNYAKTQFNASIKTVRSDNALEFNDAGCKAFFQSHGIVHQTSCAYRPQQNARVERKHRHLLEVARALMFQSGLQVSYWGEAVLTAAFIINRLPSTVLNNKCPFELLCKKPVDYTVMKSFGCLAFAVNSVHTTDKLAPRGVPCVFVGYPPTQNTQKGYRLLDLTTMKFFTSRDVTFNETIFPLNTTTPKPYMLPLPTEMPHNNTNPYIEDEFLLPLHSPDTTEHTPTNENIDIPTTQPNNPRNTSPTNESQTQVVSPRRSSRTHKTPAWMESYITQPFPKPSANLVTVSTHHVEPNFKCFLSSLTTNNDPVKFSQAVTDANWVNAMNAELEALELNDTWDITPLPPKTKSIGSRWVYKTKYKPDGTVEKYKARLVILGYRQTYGVDYEHTFAPVAKMTTVRALLAVAALQNWDVVQMDVMNAFLHGDLFETVYMKMPQGYNHFGCRVVLNQGEHCDNKTELVCKLKKSLYGLRQAPRNWFSKLSTTLKDLKYQQSLSDYSLFTLTTASSITVVLVYVDDLLLAGNNRQEIEHLKKMLSNTFKMKDLGDVRYFLGLEISRSEAGFFVSQKKYTMDLLDEFEVTGLTTLKLPMDIHLRLKADTGMYLKDPHPYQRLLGKLIYLTITRPDITFSVHILTQFMQHPTTAHMDAALKLLRYLMSNPSQGILLASSSAAELKGYCDSDWATCPMTRRSTTGYCVLLGNSPISWKTKKQSVVARSTAEAEYRSMAMAACEITWLSALLKDMGLQSLPPAVLFCDNQAALAIAANPVLHERTKHVEVDCHFVRDKINSGTMITNHVPTHSQVADIFTKALSAKQHYYLLGKLGAAEDLPSKLEGE